MHRRLVPLAALIAVLGLLLPGIAYGDNVQNDVVADDDGDKIVSVTVGQTTVVGYRVHATNNDDQNGCNAEFGTGTTVTPGALANVTVTPASRTFTSCGTAQTFSFTPSAVGTWQVSVSASGGSGGYNVNPGKFTLVATPAVVSAANTAPTLTLPADMTVEGNTTGGAHVAFSVSASDAQDGAVTPSCSAASGDFFALGGPHTVSCTATDSGGLQAGGSFAVTVVDTVAPVLSGMPGNQAASATGSTGATVSWTAPTATDTVDAAATTSCTPASGSLFALGSTPVSCTASDATGNTSAAETFSVTVTYAWDGFKSPINLDGSSAFKLGSTVPVKFTLAGASAGVADAVARIHVAKVSNGVLGTESEAVSSTPASSGSLFRWDPAGGQYIYNYGTKGLGEGTYQIRADLGDGVPHTVRFSLRR